MYITAQDWLWLVTSILSFLFQTFILLLSWNWCYIKQNQLFYEYIGFSWEVVILFIPQTVAKSNKSETKVVGEAGASNQTLIPCRDSTDYTLNRHNPARIRGECGKCTILLQTILILLFFGKSDRLQDLRKTCFRIAYILKILRLLPGSDQILDPETEQWTSSTSSFCH